MRIFPRLGPRLLMRSVFVTLALPLSFRALQLHAQVDCVYPTLHLASLHGLVVDPSGNPIPGAQVSLSRNGNDENKTTTDSMGRFSLKGVSGKYDLRVAFKGFDEGWSPVDIGLDLRSLFHPNTLRVILGVGNDTCNTLTTNNRAFQDKIRPSNNRPKEIEETNATQK